MIAVALALLSVGWPLAPMDSTKPLGNNWGEYQDYGGGAYFHPGIDVMGITIGRPVYAVQDGVVKAWLTTAADWHWRLAIADSNTADSSEAWLYAHIDSAQYHVNVGDVVQEGDLVGYLVEWPITGFDHCHFARIKDAGAVWQWPDWQFLQNPLRIMSPYADTAPPVFENALSGQRFALCLDNSSTYVDPDSIYGALDIVARIYDRTGLPLNVNPIWERMAPLRIEYAIHGPQSVPNTLSLAFQGILEYEYNVDVVYKDDGVCNTVGDYDQREYYFIVTNTDGDSIIEATDAAYAWNTTAIPAGHYWIVVTASDAAGNVTVDSMMVTKIGSVVAEADRERFTSRAGKTTLAINGRLPLVEGDSWFDTAGRSVEPSAGPLAPGVYFTVERSERVIRKVVVVR